MSSAALGKAAEKRVRDFLTERGYTIIVSHISRGPADFLAAKNGTTYAVQVKRSERSGGGIGVDAWNELIAYARAFAAIPVVVFAPSVRGMVFKQITGPKDPQRRTRQPWVTIEVPE